MSNQNYFFDNQVFSSVYVYIYKEKKVSLILNITLVENPYLNMVCLDANLFRIKLRKPMRNPNQKRFI